MSSCRASSTLSVKGEKDVSDYNHVGKKKKRKAISKKQIAEINTHRDMGCGTSQSQLN